MTHYTCTTVDLKMSPRSTPLSEVNNSVDGGPLLLATTSVDVNDALHYAQAQSVRLFTVVVANMLV